LQSRKSSSESGILNSPWSMSPDSVAVEAQRKNDRTTNTSGEAAACCCGTVSIDILGGMHVVTCASGRKGVMNFVKKLQNEVRYLGIHPGVRNEFTMLPDHCLATPTS
jgi:hypothetical protein